MPQELRRRRSPLTDAAAAPILTPMRVLFTSLPATGHINSLMPMALAVRAAGHDVAVCTSPAYAAQIEASGLRHLPGGVDRFKELFDGAPPYGNPGRIRWVQTVVFGTRAPVRMIPDLLRHVEAWQPDLLVRESGEHGAALVAEKVGLAHAGISGGSWASHDARRGLLAEALDAHRPALGLPPDPTNETMFRYLQLAFSPPSWDADALLPRTVQFIRYDNPERAEEANPPWLDASRDRPLVLASLGTVMNDHPGLMEAIVAALGGEDVDAVAVIGRDQDPARFGVPPPNVRIERFVPQIRVLERSALFVNHGGFNGTKEALRLGVPLVTIPISGDQPYTASRVAALGLGVAIGPEERTPKTIRAAIRKVLAQDRYRSAARAFAAEMAALPPIGHAVELLERLARGRQPILRDA